MRAVLLEAPEQLLEERRRKGLDLFDEVWNGVLHMVPPPALWHQRFGTNLVVILAPLAKRLGLEVMYETGIYLGPTDYRTPDVVIARPLDFIRLGLSSAAVVFEIRSPDDEAYEKLDFYAAVGVGEVFILDPDTRLVELFVLRGTKLHAVMPDENGVLRSAVLSVGFATRAGPTLEMVGAVTATI
jgi:Uma2 family endonuclease